MIACLILIFSIAGCKNDTALLEDATNQVTLESVIGPDLYTYPGATAYLYVKCDDGDKLPDEPVYVWTVSFEGNIVNELIHDKFVPLGEDAEDAEDKWPCTDEIKYEFLQEGKYIFRIDLYDKDEYKTINNLAPRRGTYTYNVYCEPVKVTIAATPTGEKREYFIKATIENKKVLGLYNYPTWRFINWTTGDIDEGTTVKITDISDFLNEKGGIDEVKHQFQRDGDFKIIFSLDDDKENEIVKAEIELNIKEGVNLAIRVPEQPLKTGHEYTFTAQTELLEIWPDAPVYHWDFGDNDGIIIPFSNEAVHLYENAGTYTVQVQLFESEENDAPLLGIATAKVEVEASANHLVELQQMKTFSLDFTIQHDKNDKTSGIYLWDYNSNGEVIWDGINFSMQWEQSGHSEFMTGRVSDDGLVIEQLKIRHEFKASDGSIQWAEIEIASLPFWTDTMPDRFIVDKSGEDVKNYVVYFNTYRTTGYQWTKDARIYVRFEK